MLRLDGVSGGTQARRYVTGHGSVEDANALDSNAADHALRELTELTSDLDPLTGA